MYQESRDLVGTNVKLIVTNNHKALNLDKMGIVL